MGEQDFVHEPITLRVLVGPRTSFFGLRPPQAGRGREREPERCSEKWRHREWSLQLRFFTRWRRFSGGNRIEALHLPGEFRSVRTKVLFEDNAIVICTKGHHTARRLPRTRRLPPRSSGEQRERVGKALPASKPTPCELCTEHRQRLHPGRGLRDGERRWRSRPMYESWRPASRRFVSSCRFLPHAGKGSERMEPRSKCA